MAKHQVLLSTLQSSIDQEGAGWQVGENFLLDLSEEDQLNYLGYAPGPDEPTLEEREIAAKASFSAFMVDSADTAYGLPTAVDWRNKGGNYVTPVKNQGSCGSCVAFGTVAAVESRIRVLAGEPNRNVNLSEAHLFYCHARSQGRNCGNGWWVPPSLNAFKNPGVSDEACYPYVAGNQNCSNLCSNWKSRVVKIKSWKALNSIQEMKKSLATNGPLIGCFTVYSDFYAYRTGVYKKTANAQVRGGHCICVIGYDDKLGCWICKNSWGSNWGDGGYFKIGYGQVGIDNTMWALGDISLWLKQKKITGLWSINENRNAWVHISGLGWKKIWNGNDTTFYMMLNQLVAAKAANRKVNLLMDQGKIIQIYVL